MAYRGLFDGVTAVHLLKSHFISAMFNIVQ